MKSLVKLVQTSTKDNLVLKGCGHVFRGFEDEVASEVAHFSSC
jgi:hypothetical protein